MGGVIRCFVASAEQVLVLFEIFVKVIEVIEETGLDYVFPYLLV